MGMRPAFRGPVVKRVPFGFCTCSLNANILRLEVLTAVNMKHGVFWDVASCGSCRNRRFVGT
jgi:hypothetical protein